MSKVLIVLKSVISCVGALIVGALGGVDAVLRLLLMLVIADMISGFLKALMNKEVSSTVMRNGFIHKVLICILIIICVQVDKVILDTTGNLITIKGVQFELRTVAIIYFCVEEFISVLENIANAGVPVPRWLRACLKQVSDITNKSTPTFILEFINKKLGVNISELNKQKDNAESSSTDEKTDDEDEKSVHQPDKG